MNNVFVITRAVRPISTSEKQAVVTARVPPMTIRMDGMLMNDPGEPPSTIAVVMSPKPHTSPMTVARSIDDLAGPTRAFAPLSAMGPYSTMDFA